MRSRQHEAEPPLHQLRPDAFIIVLISLILQGWTVATAARMFDLDAPPLQQPPVWTSISPAGSATRTQWQAIEWKRAAAPAHGERSGGDSGWVRSQRCVCPAACSWRLRARAGTPEGSCLARSRVPFLLRAGGVGRVARAPRCTEPAAGGPRVRILLPPAVSLQTLGLNPNSPQPLRGAVSVYRPAAIRCAHAGVARGSDGRAPFD